MGTFTFFFCWETPLDAVSSKNRTHRLPRVMSEQWWNGDAGVLRSFPCVPPPFQREPFEDFDQQVRACSHGLTSLASSLTLGSPNQVSAWDVLRIKAFENNHWCSVKSQVASVYNACTYSCLLTTNQLYLRCYCLIHAPTCCYLLLFATTFRSTTATSSSTNTTCCYVPTTRKPPRLRPFQVTPTTLKSRTRGKEKKDLRRVDKARNVCYWVSRLSTHTLWL